MPIRSRAELNTVNPPGQIKTLGDYVNQVLEQENVVVDNCAWPYPTAKLTQSFNTFEDWWWDPETNIENTTPEQLARMAWTAARQLALWKALIE